MDGIYLVNRFGKPVTYDQWLSVRDIADYVCTIWTEKDMSIWEVRGMKQSFVYSKIMWYERPSQILFECLLTVA